jgi:16S rRNA (uracil1498-N3)-methyltransferase
MPRSHKTLPRLFVDQPLAPGARLALTLAQANYLLNALRMRPAETLVVFNGHDGAWLARVIPEGRKSAALEVAEQTALQTPPSDLWFGFAPLKAGRLDYLVQKATEMGAGVIQPVVTRYTQAPGKLRHDKLVANVIEAAEQCEVLTVPVVAAAVALGDLIDRWQHEQGLRRLIFCDESAPSASPLGVLRQLAGLPVGLLVGPEGGFSDDERAQLLAQPFVVPISLGPRILRADTAAVAALAVVQSTIGDWR